MIDIRPLTELNSTRLRELASGYVSPAVYRVSKNETDSQTVISMNLEELNIVYEKHWQADEENEARYSRMLRQGLSLGLYDDERLVGIAIAEKQAWNRTLWIWEFHIDPEYQQRGMGRQLMEALAEIGKRAGCRVMVCETQNTNVPAIRFYRKVGFEVGAIDFSYYTNRDITDFEVAVFMKRFIE
jgi:ribosomal protein S18 acetylase RimI-like enzyme